MNTQYKKLFLGIVTNSLISIEKSLENYNNDPSKENEINTLSTMLENFKMLEDKLIDDRPLSAIDYGFLYSGALVTKELVQKRINTLQAVVDEYNNKLMPQLYEIASSPDEVKQKELIQKYFQE